MSLIWLLKEMHVAVLLHLLLKSPPKITIYAY